MPDTSVLIAYFSHSGNSQMIADTIHQCVGGDVFRIVTESTYPVDYDAVVKIAGQEQKKGSRPRLSSRVANMESYDVVFIGYPNWWSTMPMAVFSFLAQYDFSGKKIAPFCTHEGSAFGRSIHDIKELCPQSVILEGLAIRGGNAKSSMKDVRAWLTKIGMMKD